MKTLLLPLLLCLSAGCFAQYNVEPELDSCLEAGQAGTASFRVDCLYRAAAKYQYCIDTTVTAIEEQIAGSELESFRESQAAWVIYRDAQFEYIEAHFSEINASMYRATRARHRMNVVKSRAFELSGLRKLLRVRG